jgi:hypothetical protein
VLGFLSCHFLQNSWLRIIVLEGPARVRDCTYEPSLRFCPYCAVSRSFRRSTQPLILQHAPPTQSLALLEQINIALHYKPRQMLRCNCCQLPVRRHVRAAINTARMRTELPVHGMCEDTTSTEHTVLGKVECCSLLGFSAVQSVCEPTFRTTTKRV